MIVRPSVMANNFRPFKNHLYYIFIAILMLFLVIFEDDKSGNFLRGDKILSNVKTHQVAPKAEQMT